MTDPTDIYVPSLPSRVCLPANTLILDTFLYYFLYLVVPFIKLLITSSTLATKEKGREAWGNNSLTFKNGVHPPQHLLPQPQIMITDRSLEDPMPLDRIVTILGFVTSVPPQRCCSKALLLPRFRRGGKSDILRPIDFI